MGILSRHRRRYRPRFFRYFDWESIGAAICLLLLFWIWLCGLPIALPHGLAGSDRAQMADIGLTIEGRR